VAAIGYGTITSLDAGTRLLVTIALDFQGHGIGKLLAGLIRRQSRRQLPDDQSDSGNRSNTAGMPNLRNRTSPGGPVGILRAERARVTLVISQFRELRAEQSQVEPGSPLDGLVGFCRGAGRKP
jgi:hypothetical protein